MRCLLRWAVGVVAIAATVAIMKALPAQYGLEWPSVWRMVIFVPVFALVNIVVGSVMRLLALPITCITFGLFGFVINAVVFYIASSATGAREVSGDKIGFLTALFASIIFTVVSAPLAAAVKERRN